LVSALRSLGPDILIATHSTEIISEADPDEILVITKKAQSAKRVGDPSQLRSIFDVLGSNLNPFLTQLARSKRLVFVEGKDFQIISRFATKLGVESVATRSNFAVVPTNGFNPTKAKIFKEGVEATIGSRIDVALIFDRDYRSDSEVAAELAEMTGFCGYAYIHSKKELENFLLVPSALHAAIEQRVAEQSRRIGKPLDFSEDVGQLLAKITDDLKNSILAQYLKRQHPFAKARQMSLDDTTITSRFLAEFEERWRSLQSRLDMVPGKDVLSKLNTHLQEKWKVTITPNAIIGAMKEREVPDEMTEIIHALDRFTKSSLK
jgi:hypothetical protein